VALPPGARAAVVGISEDRICGTHDHAVLLAEALERLGLRCSTHWLLRTAESPRASRSQLDAWSRRLPTEIAAEEPDVVLWHYSVFSYSYRGLPVFVPRVTAALRRTGVPVIAIMHELAFPWGIGGWRGPIWSASHRAVLVGAVRLCSGIVVTTDDRAAWLRSRRWLARRPVLTAPVFSNLPPPHAEPSAAGNGRRVGLFGYSYEENAVSVVLDALRLLRSRGIELELVLLGSPGRSSATGRSWLGSSARRGVADLVSFTGTLPAQALSDALASCDVLLAANPPGPSSRKGSLAASLASGRPLVALEGPASWRALAESGAAQMVAPTAPALADALRDILADWRRRGELGARGREFAEERMGVTVTADAVIALLGKVLDPAHR
jgi:glycosyltransferase involved in cell wall biosynthesis